MVTLIMAFQCHFSAVVRAVCGLRTDEIVFSKICEQLLDNNFIYKI